MGSLILIITGLVKNPDYLNGKYFKSYVYLVTVLLIIGGVVGGVDLDTGRLKLGFASSSLMGILSALGFGICLLNWTTSKIKQGLFLFFFIALVMVSGSRIGVVMILLAFIFKFKYKLHYFVLGILFISIITQFIGTGGKESGFTRMINTFDNKEGSFDTGREPEFELAVMRLKEKMWTGQGFMSYKNFTVDDYNFSADRKPLSSHNAYLDIGIMYGLIFGGLFISAILVISLKAFRRFFKHNSKYSIHLYIVFSILLAGLTEDLIVGINSAVTYIFFISISVLGIGLNSSRSNIARKK
jgi:hypothetical protein